MARRRKKSKAKGIATAVVVLIAVIALILGGAGFYIFKAKKSGKKCIGCPDSGNCSGHCAGCTSCCHK